MTTLSASDTTDLAQAFLDAASAVNTYLMDNWDTLADAQRSQLQSMHTTLVTVSGDLITHAVGVILDEAQVSLKELNDQINAAKEAVQRVQNFDKAVKIVTALIGLATSIPALQAGNVDGVVGAWNVLVDALA